MRLFAIALTVALAPTACGNVKKHIDCAKICNEYKDCYDENYDVDACKNRCNNYAGDTNADRQAHASDCEDCEDNKSCTTEAFACANECSGIIP